MEIGTTEIPIFTPFLCTLTLPSSPHTSVSQGTEVVPSSNCAENEDSRDLKANSRSKERSQEVERNGGEEKGEVEGGEVVVEEELSLHDEEGEVVEEPSDGEESTESIVENDLSWKATKASGRHRAQTRGEKDVQCAKSLYPR